MKKIDEIFKKGLSYYIDPKDPVELKDESIFFRKDTFNAELSLGAKQIVTRFEEEAVTFSALSKLTDLKIKRTLPYYSVNRDPEEAALEIRMKLYPGFIPDRKEFLKSLINQLAENSLLVFEFTESWNKKEKANINGFFIAPDVIVLKRQNSYRREIFTLAHELGHYLLNAEEIDEKIGDEISAYEKADQTEKWCNDFAYYFLAGETDTKLTALEKAEASNDFYHEEIKSITDRTHLSEFALYTRLRILDKISWSDYIQVKKEFEDNYRKREEERRKQKKLEKASGKKAGGGIPKPIYSPLYINTMQSALIEGIIGEAEFCRRLSIKPQHIHKYL
ncbi:MAG: ImmA/IrrE family metallo-endopeptidase [Bacteroidota bacterium]